MRGFNIMTAISDEEFCAKCYSDYLNDCAEQYSKIMSAVQEASNDDFDIDGMIDEAITQGIIQDTEDDINAYEDQVLNDPTILASRVQTICSRYGINADAPLSFGEGYSTVKDTLTSIIKASDLSAQEYKSDAASAFFNIGISLTNIKGENVPQVLDVASAIDEMKSSYHATMAAAATAFASAFTNVSERLNVFNDKMSTFFRNAYDDMSNSIQYYKGLLMNSAQDAVGICRGICDALNLDSLVDDASTVNTINDTDIHQFSGASPQPALDFSTAQKVVSTTAKLVATAVKDTVVGLWNKVVKPGLFKIKKKVEELFVNPYDIEVMDSDASAPSINGWCYESTKQISLPVSSVPRYDSYFGLHDRSWYIDAAHDMQGKWFKMKTVFGEMLCRFNSVTGYTDVHVNATLKFKPYPLAQGPRAEISYNYDSSYMIYSTYSYEAGTNSDVYTLHFNPDGIDNIDEVIDILNTWKAKGELYCNVGQDSEESIIMGYTDSVKYFCFFLRLSNSICWKEFGGSLAFSSMDCPFVEGYDTETLWYPTTNKEFIRAVSGWNGSTSTPLFSWSPLYDENYGRWTQSDSDVVEAAVRVLYYHHLERKSLPFTYTFMPYQNNNANFDDSKYRVKTDTENQQALTTFMTAAVIVVIVAVVAISATIAIKKVAKARQWKMREFVGRSDNAMWNGSTLSRRDKRRYNRYNKKLNASSNAASGLMDQISSSASSLYSPSQTSDINATMVKLMRG